MLLPPYRRARHVAAVLVSLGLAAGAHAQGTDSGASGSRTAPSTTMKQSGQSGALDRADQKFMEKAANGGMMEVQLGELAQQKAASEQVKEFGKRMADDHGKANEELKQIASTKGVALPAAVDKSGQRDLEKMQKLSGADFDRAYMKHMVDDHKKDVSDFQKHARSAKDADVKQFAAKTLPTLQEHMKMAQTTYDAVKSSKSMGSKSKSDTTSDSSTNAPAASGSTPMPASPKSNTSMPK